MQLRLDSSSCRDAEEACWRRLILLMGNGEVWSRGSLSRMGGEKIKRCKKEKITLTNIQLVNPISIRVKAALWKKDTCFSNTPGTSGLLNH